MNKPTKRDRNRTQRVLSPATVKSPRSSRRKVGAAINLILAGALLTVWPLVMNQTRYGKAFSALMPIGLLLLAIGLFLLWLGRRSAASKSALSNSVTPDQALKRVWAATAKEAVSPPLVPDVVEVDLASPAVEPSPSPSRPQAWSQAVFEVIEWRRFEAVVELLFQQGGFETKSQSHGADGGVDVWLYSKNAPGKPVSLVQCKHWQGKSVGVDKIRELRGLMAAHGVQRGQFATTSSFTPDAKEFARQNGVNLLDAHGLLGLIGKRTTEQQAALLAVALEGEYWRPTCVNCGVKLVQRQPRNGGRPFWGCQNYPRCKTKMW